MYPYEISLYLYPSPEPPGCIIGFGTVMVDECATVALVAE